MFNIQTQTVMKSNTLLLAVISVLLLCTLYISYNNHEQIQVLREENYNMSLKVDSVLQICREQPQQPIATESDDAPQTTGSRIFDYLAKIGEEISEDVKKQKITVSTKYRIEDRYVRYEIEEPEFKGDQVGNVVVGILVNCSGKVNSAKVKSATGITNEEVIEACKKAALKTEFNYDTNHDYDKKQPGTITYTFTAR